MMEFLHFRRMVTPWLIEVSFVVFALFTVPVAIYLIDAVAPWAGLLPFAALLVLRLWLEAAIVLFRMNDRLSEIAERS